MVFSTRCFFDGYSLDQLTGEFGSLTALFGAAQEFSFLCDLDCDIDQQNDERYRYGALPGALVAEGGDLNGERHGACVVEHGYGRYGDHRVRKEVGEHIRQQFSAAGKDDVEKRPQIRCPQTPAHGLEIRIEQLEVTDGHHIGRAEEVDDVYDDQQRKRAVQKTSLEEQNKRQTEREAGDCQRCGVQPVRQISETIVVVP